MMLSKPSAFGFLLVGLVPTLSGCQGLFGFSEVHEERKWTEPLIASAGLDVDTSIGSITIKSDRSAKEVSIVAKIVARDITPEKAREFLKEIEVKSSRNAEQALELRAVFPTRMTRGGASVSFEVTLPEAGWVKAKTGNGAIHLDGLSKGAKLQTGIGSITVKGHQGDIEATTGNGSLQIEEVAGAVQANTSIGRVTVKEVKGRVSVRSGNGSLEIERTGGPLEARTSIGSIQIENAQDTVTATSGNGSIKVRGATQGVNARTDIGSIRLSEVGGPIEGKTGNGSIDAQLISLGNDPIHLKTSIGSIHLALSSEWSGTIEAQTAIGSIQPQGLPATAEVKGTKSRKTIRLGSIATESTLKSGNGSITVTVK